MHIQRLVPGLLLLLGCSLYTGCRSFHPIETEPPEPVAAAKGDTLPPEEVTTLHIALDTGQAPLPEQITKLQFRISQVTLIQADSSRLVREVPHALIQLGQDTKQEVYPLLETGLRTAAYDKITLTVTDIFATYGPNAGGPLTVSRSPVTVPLYNKTISADQSLLLLLGFNPQASFKQAEDCRWQFQPQLRARFKKQESQSP